MSDGDFEHPDVVIEPHGPMLVRGASSVRDAEGELHPVVRPVVALCRCDKSSRLPWCDGTHKVIPRASSARPGQKDPGSSQGGKAAPGS